MYVWDTWATSMYVHLHVIHTYICFSTSDSIGEFHFTLCISQFFQKILFKSGQADEISEHIVSFGSQQTSLSLPSPFFLSTPLLLKMLTWAFIGITICMA